MCNFFSAVFSRSGEMYYDPTLDSHEEIISVYRMRDAAFSHICRCELIPPFPVEEISDNKPDLGFADWVRLANWHFSIDEARTPDWVDEEMEQKMREKMEGAVRKMFVTKREAILSGGRFIVFPNVIVERLRGNVMVNAGMIQTLHGSCETNIGSIEYLEGGRIAWNYGDVSSVEGDIGSNYGTISGHQQGTLGANYGTISYTGPESVTRRNWGTIERMHGLVYRNAGHIPWMRGTVLENTTDGTVQEKNGESGVVVENNGTVVRKFGELKVYVNNGRIIQRCHKCNAEFPEVEGVRYCECANEGRQ